ncbi:MAG: antirestriction protein [Pseudohongiellaceae bacterium]|jgi:antirestriction protein
MLKNALAGSYCGCNASVADYAQELTDDTGNIPSHLEMYIDYEQMARDMELGGDIFKIKRAIRTYMYFGAINRLSPC